MIGSELVIDNKVLKMSNLELKGGILEMIARIDDQESLRELAKIITEFLGNHEQDNDYWEELSEAEKRELDSAILESEDESNLVDHEDVMKKYERWLNK